MRATTNLWYIRLPDGRILRATDPAVIRQQLAAGRLPPGTRVRRSGEDEWRATDRVAELADATPATNGTAEPAVTIASRLDPAQLHLAGVRHLLDELLGALDSTLVSGKLWAAAWAGLSLGGLSALALLGPFGFSLWPPGFGWLLLLAGLVVWSWMAVVVSKMTFTEVSRLRPARWRDGLDGSVGATIHLTLAQSIVLALLVAAVWGLRALPAWLLTFGDGLGVRVAAQAASVAGTVLELVLWLVPALMLPLAALVVVESGSVVSALGQWLALAWRKPARLLLAEGLAVGLALLVAGPLLLLGSALLTRTDGAEFALAGEITRRVLFGTLASVALAYLVVANVFIYLNLRYDGRA
jgi:hypothetical protein